MSSRACQNPGAQAAPDSLEPLAAYADLQSDAAAANVDWDATELDSSTE